MKNTYCEMLAIEKQQALIANTKTYRTFDAYVSENPKGESYRNWITNDGRLPADGLLIFTGTGSHSGIPGGFLWATLAQHYIKTDKNVYENKKEWYIHVHDCDDGLLVKEFPDKQSALNGMAEIEAYAPINFVELSNILEYSLEN
jgi:hypothetical protein